MASSAPRVSRFESRLTQKLLFLIFKLSLQEIGRNIIHLIQTKPNPIHESEDWPGPVTLGNPKPLDCNIQGIRFLPRGNFYPLPCGVVGRAQGTTLFVKIRSVLGSIPPGVTKKFLEWNRGTSVEIGLWHLATLETHFPSFQFHKELNLLWSSRVF